MPPAPSRRSFLRGSFVAASVPFSGCLASTGDSERVPDWAYSTDLVVHNETASERRVAVALYEMDEDPPEEHVPRTVTETPPPTRRPLYSREFRMSADDHVTMRRVLSKPDAAREYRLLVRLDSGHVAVFAFDTQYGSGMVAIVVDIRSPDELRFSRPTV